MFVLQGLYPLKAVPALTSADGAHAQIAIEDSTGDIYVNQSGTWSKTKTMAGAPVALPVNGAVTVKNSAGTVTRSLTVANGVVTLAATDAIVANGATLVLQKSDGTTSAGNATLNSPATATVAAGAVTAVKASA